MTSPDVAVGAEPLADPGERLAARIIDGLLPCLAAAVLVPMGVVLGEPTLLTIGWLSIPGTFLLLVPLQLRWLSRHGQTIGKRWLGQRIVHTDGSRVGLRRLMVLRYVVPWVVSTVPWLGGIFWVGNALLVFSRTRQCLHDRFADTVVVAVLPSASSKAPRLRRRRN